jgi:hypothetical protein
MTSYTSQIEDCPGWFLCVRYDADSNGKVTSTRGIVPVATTENIEGVRGFTQDPKECAAWCMRGELP